MWEIQSDEEDNLGIETLEVTTYRHPPISELRYKEEKKIDKVLKLW